MMLTGRARVCGELLSRGFVGSPGRFPVLIPTPGQSPRPGKADDVSPAPAQAAAAAGVRAAPAAPHALNVTHGFNRTALRMRPACSCASITGPIGL